MFVSVIYISLLSTLLYYYLHRKTRINIKYVYIDNIIVILFVSAIQLFIINNYIVSLIISSVLIILIAFGLTMVRFWRTPYRNVKALQDQIVSPADGNVIYIKKIKENEVPISIKKNSISKLSELTKSDLIDSPCWLIGINMTLFDVHKNCSPIDGKVEFLRHYSGKYLSLKSPDALTENERCSYIISNKSMKIGVVQIASKRVRRIDSYVLENDRVTKGQWIGMIRFGSQVDVILPAKINIKIKEGDQIYAIKTIIAEMQD